MVPLRVYTFAVSRGGEIYKLLKCPQRKIKANRKKRVKGTVRCHWRKVRTIQPTCRHPAMKEETASVPTTRSLSSISLIKVRSSIPIITFWHTHRHICSAQDQFHNRVNGCRGYCSDWCWSWSASGYFMGDILIVLTLHWIKVKMRLSTGFKDVWRCSVTACNSDEIVVKTLIHHLMNVCSMYVTGAAALN